MYKLLSLLIVVFLTACSITLPVRGNVQGSKETFSGSATGHIDRSGELTIYSSKGVKCSGTFVYVSMREGEGTFTCDDGRTGPFTFVSTGRKGTGHGTLGNQNFTFTFGD